MKNNDLNKFDRLSHELLDLAFRLEPRAGEQAGRRLKRTAASRGLHKAIVALDALLKAISALLK